MKNLIAQTIPLSPSEGFTGIGPLGRVGTAGSEDTVFQTFLSTTIGLMTAIAAIWFVFQFIMGAIAIISSSGDPKKMDSARKQITNAIIGVVMVIVAIYVIDFIGDIFNLDILNVVNLLLATT